MGVSDVARPDRFRLIAAVHLLLIADGQILLLRRANTGYEDGNYSVIAGHLDGDETVYAAIQREAHEEAAITIERDALRMVGVLQRRASTPTDDERIDFFLAASDWSGVIQNAEPGKCDELAWFPLTDLPTNIIPYVRQALDNYRAGIWFATAGW
ncbi:MAG TPA: NUDIX domain-containing protein [Thermomicrobiales bacterium]